MESLSLDRADHDALHEVLLQEGVDHRNREHGNHHGSHTDGFSRVVLGCAFHLTLDIIQARCRVRRGDSSQVGLSNDFLQLAGRGLQVAALGVEGRGIPVVPVANAVE